MSNRSLGDGKIAKVDPAAFGGRGYLPILKNYAFINDEKLGQVYAPLAAANVKRPDLKDLREVFREGERVIYTAIKQNPPKNDCIYIASSIVQEGDLITNEGKITEKNERYCYVEVAKPVGRPDKLFVPYSARNQRGQAWLGKGSDVGVTVVCKYFPQPDIKDCSFVAFSCFIDSTSTQGGSHKAPELVTNQIGCIVKYGKHSGENVVYSAITGLAIIPLNSLETFMGLGVWLRYTAAKNTKLTQSPHAKINWIVQDSVDLGMLYENIPYELDMTRLQLAFDAIVNRVDKSSRAAWLWNDLIGRVYLPPQFFKSTLFPSDCVQIIACFTGHFEDVPWSCVDVREIPPEQGKEERRRRVSTSLCTDDHWRVSHVQHQPQTFYSFLDHPHLGSAFAAWTDFTDGQGPPKQGQSCRVTVYRQERDKKHVCRAVMVTPLGPDGPLYLHPMIGTNGHPVLPTPFRPPAGRAPPPLPAYRQNLQPMANNPLTLNNINFPPNGVSSPPTSPAVSQLSTNTALVNSLRLSQSSQSSPSSTAHNNNGLSSPLAMDGPPPGLALAPFDSLSHHHSNGAAIPMLNEDEITLPPPLPTHAFHSRVPFPRPVRKEGEPAHPTWSLEGTEFVMPPATMPIREGLSFGLSEEWWNPVGEGLPTLDTKKVSKEEKETQTESMYEHKALAAVRNDAEMWSLLQKKFPTIADGMWDIAADLRRVPKN